MSTVQQLTGEQEHKLGVLVYRLAERGCIVRIQAETSILNGVVMTIQASLHVLGAHKTVKETITPSRFDQIPDMRVVADALYEVLRKQS